MESLGGTLKKTRESVSLTLRQVEDVTGISNAYLSQLENNKIKKPSANILYKLADVYKVDLNLLLSAAGIIKKSSSDSEPVNNVWANQIAFYAENLDDNEKDDALKYIEFLVKKKNG